MIRINHTILKLYARFRRLPSRSGRLYAVLVLTLRLYAEKKSYVVYLKEGSQIVDILNVMEAHVALMELENVRILKEMRNSVNRKVNCETANINKTVSAAVKQVEGYYISQRYDRFLKICRIIWLKRHMQGWIIPTLR